MSTHLDFVDIDSLVLLLHLLVGDLHSVDSSHLSSVRLRRIDWRLCEGLVSRMPDGPMPLEDRAMIGAGLTSIFSLTVFFRFSVVIAACSMFQVCC